jgi:hypothetical protein
MPKPRNYRHDPNFLRHVKLRASGGVYELFMWDAGRTDSRGQSYVRYEFYSPKYPDPLFIGADFAGSPMHSIDSDDAVGALLGFLLLQPGDTDSEYFGRYTPGQMAFAQGGDIEYLKHEAMRRFDTDYKRQEKAERRRYR